ncbi:metallo-beta-lactamase superfamily protein (macronuclear) [Tetrahymena thermophila SB210]|uniref:Metallo-beta-lactamase superfamily protein n=1 Tax=Tetrahymena thermophila (strain SB210) TaxID=312017 RepID=I7LXY3_TETTS|nr:metallo-beta-lactamase superfamily protein [Tetrahymena thermophila SB210]EAS06762.2 metallo-beta-lactamase superfamily protein [Tetrahymena thermophila SB210]|eukprot:XP_001027004.2 metallo-beta-lactamase superfamily protein [Tetrahymena thermophila SB210]
MKLSAYQLKQQTSQGVSLEASFGNGTHSISNLTNNLQLSANNFGSFKQLSNPLQKVAQQSILQNENKENSSLEKTQTKQIKGILKNSTRQVDQKSASIDTSKINQQSQKSIQQSAFYKGQQTLGEQNANTLFQQDDAKDILQRVDNLLSQNQLSIQYPSQLYITQSLVQPGQISNYSQYSISNYSSLPSSTFVSSQIRPTNNNSDLKSYISNLESKVIKKKDKDTIEIKRSYRQAEKKKRHLRRRKDSDSSISVIEEKESDQDSSSSSSSDESDSNEERFQSKYLSKRRASSKVNQSKKGVDSKTFKEISNRSQSQNNFQQNKDKNSKPKSKIDQSKKNKSQNDERYDANIKVKQKYNKHEKRKTQENNEDDQLSMSSYQSNVTHNGLKLNRHTNFATELVFCIVCEDYIHVEKVDEHSKYCEENQQILNQSRRVVEQLDQKYSSKQNIANAAEGFYQLEKLNQKLMKIKIYLEEMKINPNIVNSSKIRQYSTFATECCMNIIANNSVAKEMVQNLNDIQMLNKKIIDLENLSNKAVILSILVLSDKLKDFTKKKLDIIDSQSQSDLAQYYSQVKQNDQYDSKTQIDAFSDFSSLRNATQNNFPSTPSTQNQEKKKINVEIFQKQNLQGGQQIKRQSSASESVSSYQQFNSQNDLESYSVSSQSLNNQKNGLNQKFNQNQSQPKSFNNQNQNLPTQPDKIKKPFSKIFQEEKPRESLFKIQQVTHINHAQVANNQLKQIEIQQPQQYQQVKQSDNQQQNLQQIQAFYQQNQQIQQQQQQQQYLPPYQKQNQSSQLSVDIEKKEFFEIAVKIKQQYPNCKAVQQILVVDLYNQFINQRLPFSQVENFLTNTFNSAQQ